MEVPQKKRSRKSSSWKATFPSEPVGEKSRSFLQRVVFIVASHILYSRGLIPAKYFKKRQIGKTNFYVVRAEAEGKDVIHSLKGVMEAIEFAYLRDFIIMIADRDREDEYEALEVHRITKGEGEKVATINYTGIMQARRQFFHLIHRISAYGNIMSPLPQNICTIFKLTYYDEKTPPNYEPQGFMADGSLFHFSKEVQSLTLGRFDCEKHMITTSIHSVFVKNAIEMKSLMHAGAIKFNSSVSRGTTICSSPSRTLRTLSTCTDEFSQVQEDDDIEQQNNPMENTGIATSSSFIDISGTIEIEELCPCAESSISIENRNERFVMPSLIKNVMSNDCCRILTKAKTSNHYITQTPATSTKRINPQDPSNASHINSQFEFYVAMFSIYNATTMTLLNSQRCIAYVFCARALDYTCEIL
ncbi:HORMA domain-containing protein [Dirofilaria immitis]